MCKICGKEFDSIISLAKHVRMLHKYSLIDYYIKYEELVIPKCKFCNKDCKIRKGIVFTKTCGDVVCKNLIRKDTKHSDEWKKNMSETRKEWLRNNPEKHPWKNSKKFISKPCEKLKEEFIRNGLVFESELQPIEDRFYSIDIAFIDKGIGIEVNGNQHYDENKELKPYYKERKEVIEKNGWKLYDIHYSKVYDLDFVSELIKVINNEKNNIDLYFTFGSKDVLKNTNNVKCDCGEIIYKYSTKCRSCSLYKLRKTERPSKDILESEIKEFGYCGTGRKYGVSDTSIRKWLKAYK